MFAEQILAVTIAQPSLAVVESVSLERIDHSNKNLWYNNWQPLQWKNSDRGIVLMQSESGQPIEGP